MNVYDPYASIVRKLSDCVTLDEVDGYIPVQSLQGHWFAYRPYTGVSLHIAQIGSVRCQVEGLVESYTDTQSCVLNEVVAGIKQELLRGKVILHVGMVGWFDLYIDLGLSKSEIPREYRGQVITEKDLKDIIARRKNVKGNMRVSFLVGTGKDLITQQYKEATGNLQRLGAKRGRVAVLVMDIQKMKNPHTGGMVGGYYNRKNHIIVINWANVLTGNAQMPTIIAHEWAHQQFAELPQGSKASVKAWFDRNVYMSGTQDGRPKGIGKSEQVSGIKSAVTTAYQLIKLQHELKTGKRTDSYQFLTRVTNIRRLLTMVYTQVFNEFKDRLAVKTVNDFIPVVARVMVVPKIKKRYVDGDADKTIENITKYMSSDTVDLFDWDVKKSGAVTKLSALEAASVRNELANLGVVPTAYAASNFDELWAEVVSRLSVKSGKVSLALKKMMYDVLQGKIK